MANIINLGLRASQFFWTLLIMALIGNVLADNDSPSIINYSMFLAVFSMLSLFYLIPTTLKEDAFFHPLLPVVLDLLNTIFFFCGAVALAAELKVHSCDNKGYISTNKVIKHSSHLTKTCRESQASCAFIWFAFASYAASLFFSAMGARGGVSMRGGTSRGGVPSMSQV